MPDKKGRFTGRETVFIERYAATGDATYAAEKAGYSSPRQAGSQNANNPAIAAETRRRVQHQLATETLPVASSRHLEMLKDKRTKGSQLLQAIKLAYTFGLASPDDGGAKEPAEMSGDELRAIIARIRQQLADQAKPVIEHEPESGVFG